MNILTSYCDILRQYVSSTDNYCGCIDCEDAIGYGDTEQESKEDLIDKLYTNLTDIV